MPADRLTEGLMIDLNVRENAALTALDRLTVGPVRQPPPRGRRRRARALRAGRQGAVARGAGLGALRRQPAEGRDGARDALASRRSSSPTSRPRASTSARAPRSTASCARSPTGGVPVVVASSDALELEGLCDRVIVMSRGHAVATLEGDDVTEERIVHAAISATTHTAEQAARRAERLVAGSRASSRATTPRSSSSPR